MGRPTEASNPVVTPNRGALEEKWRSMGVSILEEIYRINRHEVTKEEWLNFLEELEEQKRREEQYHKEIMNNKHHPNDWEEEMGDNGNNQHDKTIATLELPIQQMPRQAPMKNISPSILPKFYGKCTKYLDGFLFEF